MKLNKRKVKLLMAKNIVDIRELSEKAELSYSTISKAVTGISLSPKTVGKIANALGVELEEIVDLNEDILTEEKSIQEDKDLEMWKKFNNIK